MNAAHYVCPVARLGVEGGLNGQHIRSLQIYELRDQRSGTEVDGDSQPIAWPEFKLGFIRQDRRIPLSQFNLEIALSETLARQPPSLGDLLRR